MNNSYGMNDTSMETFFTHDTVSTNQDLYKYSRACRDLSLLASHGHTSLDSLDYSSATDVESSSQSSLRNLMPWNEVIIPTRTATSTSRCTSSLCPVCRRGASPPTTFVTVNPTTNSRRLPPPPPRLSPHRWWEQSSSFTSALAEHLGDWVETQLLACETSLNRSDHGGGATCWQGTWEHANYDCDGGAPAPYDEASSF